MVFQARKLPDGSYTTTGKLTVPFPVEKLSALLSDFSHYSRWALKGLDGNDPVSSSNIGIFKDVEFNKSKREVVLIYDVRLFWPFGSKNNRFPLSIVSLQFENNILKSYTLLFNGSSPTIKAFSIKVSLLGEVQKTRVLITCTIKYTWFINPLMNVDGFKKSISSRVGVLADNIQETLLNNY